MTQMIRNLPVIQKTQVRSLGQEDPLQEGMATRSYILACMDRGAWGLHSIGLQKSLPDLVPKITSEEAVESGKILYIV